MLQLSFCCCRARGPLRADSFSAENELFLLTVSTQNAIILLSDEALGEPVPVHRDRQESTGVPLQTVGGEQYTDL